MAQLNPLYPESQTIATGIVEVHVKYMREDTSEAKGIIEIHTDVAQDVSDFFKEAYRLRFPIHTVAPSSQYEWDDTVLMESNVTSGFNYRPITLGSGLSLHSYGLAFDVNPLLNPYIAFEGDKTIIYPSGAHYSVATPGTLNANHPLVHFMKTRGWEWGGDWSAESGRTDYQHFQKPNSQKNKVQ